MIRRDKTKAIAFEGKSGHKRIKINNQTMKIKEDVKANNYLRICSLKLQ